VNAAVTKPRAKRPPAPHAHFPNRAHGPRIHPIQLYDAFPFGDRIHLVLEFCATDLSAIIRDTAIPLGEAHVKGFFQQILTGISYVHSRRFMHRDIKPENVLLTSGGVVKLADFGHAAPFPVLDRSLFYRVVTLLYRAPELLLRARYYSPAVDMWAAGCILAELLLRQPLFPCGGYDPDDTEERPQLASIFRLLGTPIDPDVDPNAAAEAFSAVGMQEEAASLTASAGESSAPLPRPSPRPLASNLPVWPGCSSLPGHAEFEPRKPQPWRSIIPSGAASDGALDLLSQLVVYDPLRRLTADQALQHRWFASEPKPTPPEKLPLPGKK
jgi:cyclin-dependent kinase 7